ncbi:MAG: serine hydrolase [Caulobacter sp.]|nr:serine hydrolase [Caulobacter sp.]
MRHAVVPLLALSLSATAAHADDVESRVKAVTEGLRPAVMVAGAPAQRSTLAHDMAELHVPGVSIAVIKGGKLDWARGFGVTRQGGEAVTADTLFQAGSVSKPIAAMAAVRLVQDGRLPLDADVNTVLKSWKLPASPYTTQTPVTLRALLSHTAGTTVHGFPGYAAGAPVPTVPQVLDGAAPANTQAVVVDSPVGQAYRYSGGGYTIAQLMMTDATGETFPAIVRRTVFQPVGMSASTEDQPLDAARAAHAAWPHKADGAPIEGGPHTYPEMAAAGLWTNANDLARFVMDLQGAARGEAGHALSPASAQLMLTPVKGTYGLGVGVRGEGANRYFSHDGSNAGYKATMVGYLGTGDGVVVLTNGDKGYELGERIVRAVAAAYGWADQRQVTRTAAALTAGQRAPYAGTFTLAGVGDFTITQGPDSLIAEIWKGQTEPLLAEAAGRFFLVSSNLSLTFSDPDHGTLVLDGFKGEFTRQKP